VRVNLFLGTGKQKKWPDREREMTPDLLSLRKPEVIVGECIKCVSDVLRLLLNPQLQELPGSQKVYCIKIDQDAVSPNICQFWGTDQFVHTEGRGAEANKARNYPWHPINGSGSIQLFESCPEYASPVGMGL
jgi:hypothetical protein